MCLEFMNLFLLATTILLLQFQGLKSCVEEERAALLQYKALIESEGYDADHLLPSWTDDPLSNCCGWERVTCNSSTARVIQLSLDNSRPFAGDRVLNSLWYVDLALFQPFVDLNTLDLSSNTIGGWVQNHVTITWEEKYLLSGKENSTQSKGHEKPFPSKNVMNKESLKLLGLLPSLLYLDLSLNIMEGPLSDKELANLKNLEGLNLYWNYLNGTLPIQELMRFSSLEILDLSYNNFKGSIPPSIGKLSTLKAFSVASNLLKGSLPSASRYLDFSYNDFEGSFSLSSIENHSKLEVFQLVSNNGKLNVDTESPPGWFPSFQLKVLALSNCSLNSHTNSVPSFLRHQFDLQVVDLSHNRLLESFPGWLLENNTNLATLMLRDNSFFGEFELPPFVMINTVMVDVSGNQIHGLPVNIGKILPRLEYLDLSRNAFDQDLLPSIGDMRNLQVLDLSYNNFSGEIPEDLISGCGDLRVLILSGNKLHGQIFPLLYNLSQLRVLQLKDNYFTGNLSNVKAKGRVLGNLYLLDVGYNFMTGNIGSWIGNVTYLDILVMRNNYLEGQFECEGVSDSLYYLDLSHNHLSGPLPICTRLQHLHLQRNRFDGSISEAFLDASQLLVLNLKDNSLSGNVPGMIGSLSSLRVLLLSQNSLSGLIPEELCRLKQISMMDLSTNSFFGPIPSCFQDISFGKIEPRYLDISHEKVSNEWDYITYFRYGTLKKESKQHRTAEQSFTDVEPLNQNCSTESAHPLVKSVDQSEEKWYSIDVVVFSVTFSTAYIIFFLTSIILLYLNPYWRRRWFHFFENHIYYPAYDFIGRVVNRACAKLR
ncbi:hypothetical protein V6N13_121485 [Hibiscus sabdariffa]